MSISEVKEDSVGRRRVLSIALGLNVTMFAVGLIAGVVAQSTGLIADSLDMFADATAYGIALSAMNRGEAFKARAASFSGAMLLVLGVWVLLETLRRSVIGSAPEGSVMIGVASLSLAVNATVLYLLTKYRNQGVHLRATWIFTRADVIANIGVILSGVIIQLRGSRVSDLIVGAAIGLYVVKEGFEILRKAREAGQQAARGSRL